MFTSAERFSVAAGATWLLLFYATCRAEELASAPLATSKSINHLKEAVQLSRSADPGVARSGFEALQALARGRNCEAMLAVAECYVAGHGVTENRHLAFAAYRLAADSGSAKGMFQTAVCLFEGSGVRTNRKCAMQCLTKAAELELPDAVGRLVEEYLRQYTRDGTCATEAKNWSERGAAQGIASCLRSLGYSAL